MQSKKMFVFVILGLIFLLCFSGCSYSEKSTAQNSVIMGSVVEVEVYGDDNNLNVLAANNTLLKIRELDELISKNNESAALYKLNLLSGSKAEVDPVLYSYLKQTADLYSHSNGMAQVTSGALTELWGMDTDDFRVPSASDIEKVLPLCNDSAVVFSDEDNSVQTLAGQKFNLGSVGKGIACDEAAKLIHETEGINGATVSVGGSVAIVGTHAGNDEWSVGVRNPFGSEYSYFAVLKTKETFLSTSGSYAKRFEVDGKIYHHILDLTTGYPVDNGLCSVSVIASSGLLSDVLSTMCFCLGEEQSQSILDEYGAQAIFVYNDKTVSVSDGIKDKLSIVDRDFSLV